MKALLSRTLKDGLVALSLEVKTSCQLLACAQNYSKLGAQGLDLLPWTQNADAQQLEL